MFRSSQTVTIGVLLVATASLRGDPPAPLRDRFGDALPPGAIARIGTHRLRHEGYVTGIVFTPDGSMLASCGHDGCVRLWETATGRELRCLDGAKAISMLWRSPPTASCSRRRGEKEPSSSGTSAPARNWIASAGASATFAAWPSPRTASVCRGGRLDRHVLGRCHGKTVRSPQ